MKKMITALAGLLLLAGCSNINFQNALSSLTSSVPDAINQAVASRVDVEKELYTVGSASIGQTGSIIAQSKANKMASDALKSKIKNSVEAYFKTYTMNLDGYSKNLVSPAIPELSSYATDLISKQVKQKGAWEDSDKVYSLLAVPNSEVATTTQKVLKSFLANTAKKLESISGGI